MDTRLVQAGCSCSYSVWPTAVPHRGGRASHARPGLRRQDHRPSPQTVPEFSSSSARGQRTTAGAAADLYGKGAKTGDPNWATGAGGTPGPRPQLEKHEASGENRAAIQGYTPSQYIVYSDKAEHTCRHRASVVVEASPTECFELWNDWCRLVDFLDLVSQIGLDPNEPDLGLFQCFYRWGRMPVLEVVFLLRKKEMADRAGGLAIEFISEWGCPLEGIVRFEPLAEAAPASSASADSNSSDGSSERSSSSGGGSSTSTSSSSPAVGLGTEARGPSEGATRTKLTLEMSHSLPLMVVETVNAGAFAIETHMLQILRENLADFKALAEAVAHSPESVPDRQEPQSRDNFPSFMDGYPVEVDHERLDQQEAYDLALEAEEAREGRAERRRQEVQGLQQVKWGQTTAEVYHPAEEAAAPAAAAEEARPVQQQVAAAPPPAAKRKAAAKAPAKAAAGAAAAGQTVGQAAAAALSPPAAAPAAHKKRAAAKAPKAAPPPPEEEEMVTSSRQARPSAAGAAPKRGSSSSSKAR